MMYHSNVLYNGDRIGLETTANLHYIATTILRPETLSLTSRVHKVVSSVREAWRVMGVTHSNLLLSLSYWSAHSMPLSIIMRCMI